MAGAPSATLEGYAIPLMGWQRWDHTYVVSSCRLRWACWGRSNGGASVCAGIGSSIIADCLSQVNSQAGIRYGVTGVCHQTANRILFPASVTVWRARGYPRSVFLWGAMGRGPWPERVNRYSSPGGSASPSPHGASGGSGSQANPPKSQHDRSIAGIQEAGIDDEKVRLAELSALVELGLGRPLDRERFNALAAIQRDLRKSQEALADDLEKGKITPEAYLGMLDQTLTQTMHKSEELLGYDNFKAIFGEPPQTSENLIDSEAFLRQFRVVGP
jgi:hypothetical protein